MLKKKEVAVAKEITVFLCVLELSGGWGGGGDDTSETDMLFLMEAKELSKANKCDLPRDLPIRITNGTSQETWRLS